MQMDSGQHHPLLLPEFPPRNLKQHAGPIDHNIISPHPPDWSVPIRICLLNGNNAVVMNREVYKPGPNTRHQNYTSLFTLYSYNTILI